MTSSEIEAWLKKHHPSKPWAVDDTLGIGLPMLDNVVFYAPLQGRPLEQVAKYVILVSQGKHLG